MGEPANVVKCILHY